MRSPIARLPNRPRFRCVLIGLTFLTYNHESLVHFRYKLNGPVPNWVETDTHQRGYPSLRLAWYTFEPLACSSDQVWSKHPERLPTLRPPWWQRGWFRLLELAAFLATARALWGWRTAQLVKRQRALERTVGERMQQLEAERKKFEELATWDALTGVWNRRAIFELLSNELARAKRSGDTVSVIMADLDRFKQINDQYGHQAGDAVLQEAAKRMKAAVRISDGVGRYGGEEFLIILPGCDAVVALRRAEEIRKLVARDPVALDIGELDITCSLGVNWTREGLDDPSWLIKEADAALYRAKHEGRNRVEAAAAPSEI